MESTDNQPKHTELKEEEDKGETTQEVVRSQNKYIPNIASPFLKQYLSWDKDEQVLDEETKVDKNKFSVEIPADIKRNIEDGLQFLKPSGIQATAIPMIVDKDGNGNYMDVIAQSKNGSGKTGAFTIGSVLRIERSI
jgi:superfamily II DNA/RNA helicase